jgi:hypothetical protein
MKMTYSKSFKALWIGEIISVFAGSAGGIVNGLLLYEITGSKEWMGALWLVYFLPSLILQGISAPFLNHVIKEKLLRNLQLIRSAAYLSPFRISQWNQHRYDCWISRTAMYFGSYATYIR